MMVSLFLLSCHIYGNEISYYEQVSLSFLSSLNELIIYFYFTSSIFSPIQVKVNVSVLLTTSCQWMIWDITQSLKVKSGFQCSLIYS